MPSTRRAFLQSGAAAALAPLVDPGLSLAAGRTRPNIVLLIVIDTPAGADYVGAYDGGRAPTAIIEPLAERGRALHTLLPRGDGHAARQTFDHDRPAHLPVPRLAPLAEPRQHAGLGNRSRRVDATFTSALARAGYWTGYVTDNPYLGSHPSMSASRRSFAQFVPLPRPTRRYSSRPERLDAGGRALARSRAAPAAYPGTRAPLPSGERALLARRVPLVGRARVQPRRPVLSRKAPVATALRAGRGHVRAARAMDAAASSYVATYRRRRRPWPPRVPCPVRAVHARGGLPAAPAPGPRIAPDARRLRRRGNHDGPLAGRAAGAASRTLPLERETIVVLVSDHGHLLGEYGWTGKIASVLHPRLIHVPLVLVHPLRT